MKTSAVMLASEKPKLFKARTRYFRWVVLSMIPLIAVTEPLWDEHSLVGEALPLLGLVCSVSGVIIRIFSTLYVGGRKNDALITDGPFSVVRNPLYVGSLLATIGLGLLVSSMLIAALALSVFVALHAHTIAREEEFLLSKFGAEYEAYRAKTPCWLPRLSLWQSPSEISVKPAFILRTIRDGMVFILAVPALMALAELRDHGFIPTLFFVH